MADFSKELGAQPPLGFWDPFNFLSSADEAYFNRLRTVEIKHGRISMLAILGHLVTTAGARLPGDIAYGVPFSSIRTGLAAFSDIPLAVIAKDIESDIEVWQNANGWSEEKKLSKRAIELNNGRAAQVGILALAVHEKLNNDPYIINSLLGFPVPFNQ
eukprot:gene18214-23879_t